MTKEPKPKIGRPSTGLDKQLMLRCSPDWIKAIDTWRKQQPDKPPLSVAIRRLVDSGLRHGGK